MNRHCLVFGWILTAAVMVQAAPKEPLPKVVLIGDSIRMGYAPLVAKKLEGRALILSAEANGGDSRNVLKNIGAWAIQEQPAVIHFNCGLHDLIVSKSDGRHQVALTDYETNLRQLVSRLRRETKAVLVFANTTPIIDERHAQRGGNFDRYEEDVRRYNATALQVMRQMDVPVHDLHGIVERYGTETLLDKDGTHYTRAGSERLAEAVADCVMRHLIVSRYTAKPAALPQDGPEAAARYRKTEAERDATVPATYKNLPIGKFVVPADAPAWKQQRPGVRQTVIQSLGDLPSRPAQPRGQLISRELRHGYVLERVAIDNGEPNDISALVLIPLERQEPAPAILWLHSSTPDKNQIITPNTNGGEEPLGEAFVRAGYVVVALDASWYGDRAANVPGGEAEAYRRETPENAALAQDRLLKLNLWLGRTSWGMMVRDDQIALDYLCTRPEVDAQRIGVTGMSMGSTRAWWLAAVDERVAAVVGVACLTRYENLINHGNLRAHGLYYFSYGLLKHFDTEGVLSLIAPRPYLALTGDLDYGSPADGIKVLEEKVGATYRNIGAPEKFKNILYPDTGHTYTHEMRIEMLTWFERWLKPSAR